MITLAELNAAKEKVAELEKQYLADISRPVELQIADRIHDISCHFNHTDGCGWWYEKGDEFYYKSNSTKNGYYKKAVLLVKDEDPDTILRILTKYPR